MKFEEALPRMLAGELMLSDLWQFRIHNGELETRPTLEGNWVKDVSGLGWLLGRDWAIYTPPPKPVTFAEAIKACQRGKTVKFSTWIHDTMRLENGRFVYNNSTRPVELMSYFHEPRWIIL